MAVLFYLVSAILFFIIITIIKKDDSTNHSTVAWVVIHSGVMMWVNTCIAGIYALVGIPFTLLSVAIAYDVLSGMGIIYIHNKGIQRLKWNTWDLVAVLCIVAVAAYFGLRFNKSASPICDVTGDSCMHFRYALNVSNTGIVKGEMFYAPCNNGLFLSILKPLLEPFEYYRSFFAMAIMMVALAGCAIYAIICDMLKKPMSRLFGLALALMYMLGYPLNNYLMGFCYLGMSVTIVVFLFFFLRMWIDDTMRNNWALGAMMMGCFALVMCYMLFAPIIFIAVFITLVLNEYRRSNLQSFIKIALKVFLVPCILGFYYCYFCFFKGRNLSIGDAIKNNGGTRGHYYSNLLIFLPTTVYFLITDIKQRKHIELTVLTLCVFTFDLIMLALVFLNKISIYYYSKLPYLTWFSCAICSWYGLKYLLEDNKKAFIIHTSFITCLLFVWAFNVNGILNTKSYEMGYGMFVETYRTVSCGAFEDNRVLMNDFGPYSPDRISLFRYIYDNLGNSTVPLLGDLPNYLDVYWCENLTGQDLSDYYFWTAGAENCIQRIAMRKEVDYVTLMYGTQLYEDTAFIWNRYEKVYENEAGCILKIA